MAADVYIGLGSNLGDRLETLRSAVRSVGRLAGTEVVRCSPVFETRPIGPSDRAYLNAVAHVRTTATPEALLAGLQGVEAAHGRVRRTRWEARTLDLDVLVWDGEVRDTPALRLPHPELARRDFVLAPLAALASGLRPDGGATVGELLAALAPGDRTILERLPAQLC